MERNLTIKEIFWREIIIFFLNTQRYLAVYLGTDQHGADSLDKMYRMTLQ